MPLAAAGQGRERRLVLRVRVTYPDVVALAFTATTLPWRYFELPAVVPVAAKR
jgi:hypothetical protein